MMNRERIISSEALIDNEVKKVSKDIRLEHTVIIVLFYGERAPKYCVQMSRNPESGADIPIKSNFWEIYSSMVGKNLSIRDGAILVKIDCVVPMIKGFSYRIYPPYFNVSRKENLGSGYNSSLDFSNARRVGCVYFMNVDGIKKFIKGKEVEL